MRVEPVVDRRPDLHPVTVNIHVRARERAPGQVHPVDLPHPIGTRGQGDRRQDRHRYRRGTRQGAGIGHRRGDHVRPLDQIAPGDEGAGANRTLEA